MQHIQPTISLDTTIGPFVGFYFAGSLPGPPPCSQTHHNTKSETPKINGQTMVHQNESDWLRMSPTQLTNPPVGQPAGGNQPALPALLLK